MQRAHCSGDAGPGGGAVHPKFGASRFGTLELPRRSTWDAGNRL